MKDIHEYAVTATVGMTQDCDVAYLSIEHGTPPVANLPKGAGYYVMFYAAAYMISTMLRDVKVADKASIDHLMADVRKVAEKIAANPMEFMGNDPTEASKN